MSFGDSALNFLKNLEADFKLPAGVSCLLPFSDPAVVKINKVFYKKFYNDTLVRKMIIGINPGRFGAGVTGISFTDPIKLETELGIPNDFKKRSELSSDFIYDVIRSYGGPELFYRSFYVTAVSPIGFIKDNKNINYYENKILNNELEKFIVNCLNKQLKFGIDRSVAFCLGEGENFKFLKKLNEKYLFFEKIIPLAHPRFIMQYRRKTSNEFVKNYINAFRETPDAF